MCTHWFLQVKSKLHWIRVTGRWPQCSETVLKCEVFLAVLQRFHNFQISGKELSMFKHKAISIFSAPTNWSLFNYSSSFRGGTTFILNYFRFWQSYKQRILIPRKLYQFFQQSIFSVVSDFTLLFSQLLIIKTE